MGLETPGISIDDILTDLPGMYIKILTEQLKEQLKNLQMTVKLISNGQPALLLKENFYPEQAIGLMLRRLRTI